MSRYDPLEPCPLWEAAHEFAYDEIERLVPGNTGTESWYDGALEAITAAKYAALCDEASDNDPRLSAAEDRAWGIA